MSSFELIAKRHKKDPEIPNAERAHAILLRLSLLNGTFYDNQPYPFHQEFVGKRFISIHDRKPNAAIRVPINQRMFDALVSFTYNVGVKALNDSTLLKLLNQRDYRGAADQFKRWNRAGGKVSNGLTKRRAAEEALFLSRR